MSYHFRYSYDDQGRLTDIRARDGPGTAQAPGRVITHNRYQYDGRSHLVREYQSHGQEITSSSSPPFIEYAWDYRPTAINPADPTDTGFDRLGSMLYPDHGTDSRGARKVELAYGVAPQGSTAPSIDWTISRITSMKTRLQGQLQNVASYPIAAMTYSGGGRRVSLDLGANNTAGFPELRQSFVSPFVGDNPGVGLLGLDSFGRLKHLHYFANLSSTSSVTFYRAQYEYDSAGNRTRADIIRVPVYTNDPGNRHSQLNQYDSLDRLIGSSIGQITSGSNGDEITAANLAQGDSWKLDLLGNWTGIGSGNSRVPGRTTTHATGSMLGTQTRSYDVDQRNQINTSVLGNGTSSTATPTLYDAAGNIAFDGIYLYQYDAWNRLVQINQAHTSQYLTDYQFPGKDPRSHPGEDQESTHALIIDGMVKHFTYDGLGRLIRTQSPFPDPQTQTGGALRSERFYYDGARRIQELVVDPVISMDEQSEGGTPVNGGSQQGGTVDGSAAPIDDEQQQISSGTQFTPPAGVTLAHEYIHGPGDSFAGVDETFCVFDGWAGPSGRTKPWWTLQDAGGDVIATSSSPHNASGAVNGTAGIGRQFVYDAYGSVVTADSLGGGPNLSLGHKGLFLDRLDTGVAPTSATGDTPRLQPQAKVVYYVRNRAYMPDLGRWMQRDPSESGAVLIARTSRAGAWMHPTIDSVDALSASLDGCNLFAYLCSSPYAGSDPLGLFLYGPEDFVMMGIGALRGGLEGMINQYAANTEFDIDWASNWSRDDRANTRFSNKWIKPAFAEGMLRGFLEQADPTGGLLADEIISAGVSSTVKKAGRGVRILTGQLHHAISTKIFRAIKECPLLKDAGYIARDERLVTRAATTADHIGYQRWHRDYDRQVVEYLEKNAATVTPALFEGFLKALYETEEMLARFPNGL